MKTPERYEKDEVDKYLKEIGAYIVKQTSFGFGSSGHSDRICCILGIFWGIEVKREGKGPTKLQTIRIQDIKKAGGQATWGVASQICAEIERWRQKKLKQITTLGL